MQGTNPYPNSSVGAAGAAAGISERAHGTIDRVSATAHDAVERAAGAATVAADRLGSKSRALLAAREEWMDATRTYVREHPLQALGIALAAGYLLSRIVSR
jgi:ElaB/YqjD/DUF883 family membrane-anchored ribosome-binding protein